MPTILLRLIGPLQSWGTTSRFNERDTGKEPSKSGVIGLLAAARGIDRGNWDDLEPMVRMPMGVRHDRAGIPRREYQTAGCNKDDTVIKADGTRSKDGVVSTRHYLADSAFLVGMEGNRELLDKIQASLQNPVWPLSLGRKSYVPSEPIWLDDGIQDVSLKEALSLWPWIVTKRSRENVPDRLLLSSESFDGSGSFRMDQPLSSFAERKFGGRYVQSEWIPFPAEGRDVSP
ncbi:MAG TPA: type I-E CRISPR-associated protein Cas5/CasD [Candidatus Deferrimicrobiaceae bacterium]|jgi:CRISPR system Cascade subunit CasD